MRLKGKDIKDGKILQLEARLHYDIVQYLKIAYPRVLFRTDPSGELMTEAQRIRQAKLNIPGTKMPDLIILEARHGYHALFLELKKEDVKLYKANGLFSNEHLSRQAGTLELLRQRGYKAEFAKGFQAARKIIDSYLQ